MIYAAEFYRFELEILQGKDVFVHDCEQGKTACEPHPVFAGIQAECFADCCCFSCRNNSSVFHFTSDDKVFI